MLRILIYTSSFAMYVGALKNCQIETPQLLERFVSTGSCTQCFKPRNSIEKCLKWSEILQCPDGFYNTGAGSDCVDNVCSAGTCERCTCAAGTRPIVCDSTYTAHSNRSNLECVECENALPDSAFYIEGCSWQCLSGRAFDGKNCVPCATECPLGSRLDGVCLQTPFGDRDTTPTCVQCGLFDVLKFGENCEVLQCSYGFELIDNKCVAPAPPPSPPHPSPPPPPASPPPAPPALDEPPCVGRLSDSTHFNSIFLNFKAENTDATILTVGESLANRLLIFTQGSKIGLNLTRNYVTNKFVHPEILVTNQNYAAGVSCAANMQSCFVSSVKQLD